MNFWRQMVAVSLCTLLYAGGVGATKHLYEFEQLFTNADGTIQFIVMHQTPPEDEENEWAGASMEISTATESKSFVIPTNLPSSATSRRRVLLATQAFAALKVVTPDYIMPNGFLSATGGTLRWAETNFTYLSLPTDGITAFDATFFRPTPNVATNFAGETGSVRAAVVVPTQRVVEFYNPSLDHYFITRFPDEIAALDAGTALKGWTRTGQSFNAYATAEPATSPVCRFYMPPAFGDSHFFGRGTVECTATAAKNPAFVLEDSNFMHVFLPSAGACAATVVPIYRVFSNRADANHRYMTDPALRDQMVARGWLAEGDGPNLVVMCAPR